MVPGGAAFCFAGIIYTTTLCEACAWEFCRAECTAENSGKIPPHHLYVQSQAAAPIPVFASFERLIALCRKCEGHEDAVRVLAVASGRVFSGSYDGTIGVW